MESIECEYFEPNTTTPVAYEKVKLHIIMSKWKERSLKMLPGIILRQVIAQPIENHVAFKRR